MQWQNCGTDAESKSLRPVWDESGPSSEMKMRILRLTTHELKNSRGTVPPTDEDLSLGTPVSIRMTALFFVRSE